MVVDHDRGLADLAHEVERLRQGFIAGLLAADQLHQRHLVDGREKVDANKVIRLGGRLGQLADR